MRTFLAVALIAMLPGYGCAQSASATGSGQRVQLDHVVAAVNGEVLLESDVDEEMHFAALELVPSGSGKDTQQDAMTRLVNRTLIVQQMKEQQLNLNIPDADVEKALKDVRAHLPECAKYNCSTDAGWTAFLAAHDLTNQEVFDHWKERMAILRFIDQRFRTGIRIPQESVADYYAKTLVPRLVQQGKTAPPLKNVSARIQEVLLQQQVNGMLQDWLNSLRQEGSIRVLDPAYAVTASTSASETKTGTEE